MSAVVVRYVDPDGNPFVLECDYLPKTNGLGKTQRAIVGYLATAPAGFAYAAGRRPGYSKIGTPYRRRRGFQPADDLLWHGQPSGVLVSQIASAVYGTDSPTASQIRITQRAVRRLESLGLVDCWHTCAGYVERPYVDATGAARVMSQAVAALAVAIRWDCEHFAEQDRLVREAERRARLTGLDAMRLLMGGGA